MRPLCLLAFLIVSVVADISSTDNLDIIDDDCIASSGVEKIKVDELRKGIFAEDPKLKNFLKCVLTKSGSINEDGTFKKSIVKANFEYPEDTLDTALRCTDIHGTNVDDTVFLNYKCLIAAYPTI